jgi:shikimate dehydrogenase
LTSDANTTKSVNTIYVNNNRLIGDNTDIIGFQKSIELLKYNLNKKVVFILGAGGVVPSIIFALIKMKASRIIISNRTKKKAEAFKRSILQILRLLTGVKYQTLT